MSDTALLKVSGRKFEGWTNFSVSLSMETIASSFRLDYTDRETGSEVAWPITPQDPCEIYLGSDRIITGYVDSGNPSCDATGRKLSVEGRSKAGDLVDCSVDISPFSWRDIYLDSMAKIFCQPFGIPVKKLTSVGGKFSDVIVNTGESFFEVLDRMARQRGVLLLSNFSGELELTTVGAKKASEDLIQGINVKSASGSYSVKERFSKYTVKTQLARNDDIPAVESFKIQASSTDPNITRHRPLLISSEAQTETINCKTRANFEAMVRAGRSTKVNVTVEGYRQKDGSLWSVNQLVYAKIPWIGIAQELLISGVTFTKDASGSNTTLELVRKDAFTPQPVVPSRGEILRALVKSESR